MGVLMPLRKRKVNLNIMQSTNQITADKISINPSSIENVRFEKGGEVKKRLGIKYIAGGGEHIASIGNTAYAASASGFKGIDRVQDVNDTITTDPLLRIGIDKHKVFPSGQEVRAIAHARGENYNFVGYNVRNGSSIHVENKILICDDDFNVLRDVTDVSSSLEVDFESIAIVSYQKNSHEYVTVITQTTTGGYVRAFHFDENGDYISFDNVITTSPSYTIAAVSTGTGFYLAGINSSNQLIISLYDGSSYTTVTSSSTAFASYGVGSISYFDDYVYLTINPTAPAGATAEAKLVQVPLGTWPSSITPSINSLSIGGYLPKWMTTTKVDSTYHMVMFTDYDAAKDHHRAFIKKMSKSVITTSQAILVERCSTIGHAYISSGKAYAMLMTQNGYNPMYHFIRIDIPSSTTSYFETVSSFLSGEAPTSEFYAYGLVGQNPVEGQWQYLYRSQPTFSWTTSKLHTIVPVQPLGQEYANWRALTFDFTKTTKSIEANNLSLIASGTFSVFDGIRCLRGVTAYPEILSTNASGSTYNYSYIPVYKTVDGNGNTVRSLIGPAVSIQTGSVISAINPVSVTMAKKALLFNDYPSSSNVIEQGVYELYRTENNGTVFYKTVESYAGSPTILADSTADSDLINNILLYTTGGILENTYPEVCNDITFCMGRVWSIGNDDLVEYSKEIVQGESVYFNDGLAYRIDGGKNTAIGKLGNRVAVFKQRSCYLLYGNPATNIGAGQNLTHQEISNSIGCISPASLVEYDNAIMFLSEKGIYRLTSSGALDFVGKDVIDYTNNNTLGNAALVKDKNEIIYTFTSGLVLIFNYLFGIWSFDEHSSAGIVISKVFSVDDKIYYISGFTIYRDKTESDTYPYQDTFSLNNYNYKMKYSTGWLKYSEVGGFQRVYRLFILGSKTTDQNIIVSVYNDYDEVTPSQVKSFTLLASDPLEFELHVARQKGEAIKFVIEEDITSVDDSDLVINGIALQIGAKRGFNKLSPDLRL
jgi:hypothetical protein